MKYAVIAASKYALVDKCLELLRSYVTGGTAVVGNEAQGVHMPGSAVGWRERQQP